VARSRRCMDGRIADGAVRVGGDARQRFYDSRGYGRPLDGDALELAPVEAAHLLFRGDLDAVDGMDFRAYFAHATERVDRFAVRFLVYADLRGRGFYLAPPREDGGDGAGADADLLVFPRGSGPWDDAVAYRVRVVGERAAVDAAALATAASGPDDAVLAVVDEESDITYLELAVPEVTGSSGDDLATTPEGAVLGDRVLCWDPPASLYESAFFGRPLSGREGIGDDGLQLSLVEAAYLAAAGSLSVDGGAAAVREHGRRVEGERFDRRLTAYTALREAGVVPKTGFKFGADFRTYADVESVDDLGHSEFLVRVLPADHAFAPRDLALDVRLAGSVRKEMAFALVDGDDVTWLSVGRLTP
jgi:tRNA-intron endonuclease